MSYRRAARPDATRTAAASPGSALGSIHDEAPRQEVSVDTREGLSEVRSPAPSKREFLDAHEYATNLAPNCVRPNSDRAAENFVGLKDRVSVASAVSGGVRIPGVLQVV
ncbi:unnamed protein product [Tuber aestivum]|uniref:Uncharacterized protein n=1 Tax=Tuber aestivum TaxID=59557 RepID=A0A292PN42_9PEZI|nr:unnamed protein product [Tuber aestivum]